MCSHACDQKFFKIFGRGTRMHLLHLIQLNSLQGLAEPSQCDAAVHGFNGIIIALSNYNGRWGLTPKLFSDNIKLVGSQ